MNWYPPAERAPILPGPTDPAIIPVGVIFHVAVSRATSLRAWFSGPSKGIESHLYVRRDGTVEQYRSLTREADAQLGGNSWLVGGLRYGFLSVETQGMGGGRWSKRQLSALVDFAEWTAKEYGFPIRVVTVDNPPSAKSGGLGYHSMRAGWNRLKKSCPGRRRIRQFNRVILPALLERRDTYTVKPGDTIETVTARFDLKPASLWRLNRPHLQPGEKLRIR